MEMTISKGRKHLYVCNFNRIWIAVVKPFVYWCPVRYGMFTRYTPVSLRLLGTVWLSDMSMSQMSIKCWSLLHKWFGIQSVKCMMTAYTIALLSGPLYLRGLTENVAWVSYRIHIFFIESNYSLVPEHGQLKLSHVWVVELIGVQFSSPSSQV